MSTPQKVRVRLGGFLGDFAHGEESTLGAIRAEINELILRHGENVKVHQDTECYDCCSKPDLVIGVWAERDETPEEVAAREKSARLRAQHTEASERRELAALLAKYPPTNT